MAQLHDAILIDYPDDGRDEEVRQLVSSYMKVPLHARERNIHHRDRLCVRLELGKMVQGQPRRAQEVDPSW
jgi:hypothetical protein